MEPLSAFYTSPLVVLDFQSLYPSIMIAYNYCYSTCLGRVTDFKGQFKFGVTDLRQPAGLLGTLKDYINGKSFTRPSVHCIDMTSFLVAPNGIMYVKQEVRRGLLGRMLTELLDTRVMVKQAMKGVKDDKVPLSASSSPRRNAHQSSSGPPTSSRRSATRPEVHRKRDIRLYERDILGSYASSRDS